MLSLDEFKNKTVAVIGDFMLDVYHDSKVERISPEAPIMVINVDNNFPYESMGGAGNTAMNLVNLGASVHLFGFLGKDESGKKISSYFKSNFIFNQEKMNMHFEFIPEVTPNKVRYTQKNHQIIRIDYEHIPLNITPTKELSLLNSIEDNLDQFNAIIISDYGKGTVTERICTKTIQWAMSKGIPVFIDPKGTNWCKYEYATCITPNWKEFKALICEDDTTIENEQAKLLLEDFCLEQILITKSEKGMSYYNIDKESIHIASCAREICDVSGAGDTVIATFTLAYISNFNIPDALNLANTAARIVVGKSGTCPITKSELEEQINNDQKLITDKLVPDYELIGMVQKWREAGYKINFTNGCFDILHAGHIKLIKEASKHGGKLIVAINSDDSIKKIKANGRPIISQEQRASIISSIEGVDAVVIFNDETPYELIKSIIPDVLIKGGDYTKEQVVGSDIVEMTGGTTVIIPLLKNISSTEIINKVATSCLS
jgi:D-beta-D-heptose 7-phosphate kinase / D-beta-D-heptose 1-phosphate adenosyltransferase